MGRRRERRRPSTIRFTQDSIQKDFQNGESCLKLYDDVKNGVAAVANVLAIRVAEKDGLFYSSDNRRLYVFRALEYDGIIEDVLVEMVRYEDLSKGHTITTNNNGVSVRVRGCINRLPHSIDEIKAARSKREMCSKSRNNEHTSRNPLTYLPSPPQHVKATETLSKTEYMEPCFNPANAVSSPQLTRNTPKIKKSPIPRSDYNASRSNKTHKKIHRPPSSPVYYEDYYSTFDDYYSTFDRSSHWDANQNRKYSSRLEDDDPKSYNWWNLVVGGCAAAALYYILTKPETTENVPSSSFQDVAYVPPLLPRTTPKTLLGGDHINGDLSFLQTQLFKRIVGDPTQPFEGSVEGATQASITAILASMFSGSITALGNRFSLIRSATDQVIFLPRKLIRITPTALTRAGSVFGSVIGLTPSVFSGASAPFRQGFTSFV